MKHLTTLVIILNIFFSFSQSSTINTTTPKKVVFKDASLNNVLNIKNADVFPIYKGCENKTSNLERENCLKTNLIIDTTNRFTASEAPKKAKLKKGIKRIRVIFIIDKNGKTIVKQILGNWPQIIIEEITKSLEETPQMTPAKLNEKNIAVKYSVRIPFNVK